MGFIERVFSGRPSQADFAAMVVKAFEESGIAGLEYREEDFSLKRPDTADTIFLSNAYTDYSNLPRNKRKAVIAKLVAGLASIPDTPEDFASARKSLMPVVRAGAYESLTDLLHASESRRPRAKWAFKPLVGDLQVGLAYDSEHNISSVSETTLHKWGLEFDEAFAVAKANLWDRTDPQRLTGQVGVYWGEWGDSYDSSRILLTEFIYRLDLDGDPVAMVPSRDALLITGRNSHPGLRVLLNAGAETHVKRGYPVSPDLFVLEDGVWKTFVPEHPELREFWRNARRNRDGLDYAHQKSLLDKLTDREDVFNASYMMFKSDDGSGLSVCVWARDVDTSLPRAEFLAFVLDSEGNDKFRVVWDDFVSVVGNLLEQEPGLIPVRFRARKFPSDDQIARLRRMAK